MTINQMRSYILDFYPHASQKWRGKVLEMPSNQIVAIYKSILSREDQTKRSEGNSNKEEYHQMDIWEYLVAKNEAEGGPGTHTEVKV